MKRNLDLNPETLVQAYSQGLFPMDVDGEIRWFSPNPRAILPLDGFHAPGTLRQLWRQGRFEIRSDTRFREVMLACGERVEGTWISDEIVEAYCRLFALGLAHSLEIWQDGELSGGLYGVKLGGAFFGESMFHRRRDASKLALMALVDRMRRNGFTLLDVQFATEHLERFGVIEIPRSEYLELLSEAIATSATW